MLVITVEFKDPLKPSKTTKALAPDEAASFMRECAFRVALGEYTAVYMTKEAPLNVKELKQ